jgi:hypothetical protein
MGASNCTGYGGSDCCTETRHSKVICCEIHGKKISKPGFPRVIPQPPAGFIYHNSTTKANESQTPQSSTRERPGAPSASSESNEKERTLMAESILKALMSDRGPKNTSRYSSPDVLSTKSGTRASRQPQLELALVKAMKVLPKTGPDCLRCFKHIQGSRVAIFSKSD